MLLGILRLRLGCCLRFWGCNFWCGCGCSLHPCGPPRSHSSQKIYANRSSSQLMATGLRRRCLRTFVGEVCLIQGVTLQFKAEHSATVPQTDTQSHLYAAFANQVFEHAKAAAHSCFFRTRAQSTLAAQKSRYSGAEKRRRRDGGHSRPSQRQELRAARTKLGTREASFSFAVQAWEGSVRCPPAVRSLSLNGRHGHRERAFRLALYDRTTFFTLDWLLCSDPS